MIPPLLALLGGCQGGGPLADSGPGPGSTEAPLEPLFSFAVFADPHLTQGNLAHQERLAAAVDWVNAHAAERGIELVWVVGDIGWSGGLDIARSLLEDLDPVWIPVLGDNEVHLGAEQTFDAVFADQYAWLAGAMEGWERGQVQVTDPASGRTLWLQNFAFDHRGIRWVGLDWVSRDEGLLGEFGELNDLPGGSLPWFAGQIGELSPGADENVLLFSHHAMHLGSFDLDELDRLARITGPRGERVAANYAGHYHINFYEQVEEGAYEVFVTDGMWEDENTVRVVQVLGNGRRFAYEQELVVVP